MTGEGKAKISKMSSASNSEFQNAKINFTSRLPLQVYSSCQL